jgi:S1-C subfamily serine protease
MKTLSLYFRQGHSMLKSRLRVLFVLLVLVSGELKVALAGPAEPMLGESIYKAVSEAVFAVEVLDEKGNVSALGTAFLIEKQRLVTNYHVVQGGTPHLRVGTLRVECVVEKLDPANDLALLSVSASIAAAPLALSSVEPASGSTVFAIGNPAGLEKTITQGLVSGTREIEGQSLLQISAAISPGSSGGPVVNTQGEVVGVAVGYLKNGQNLNFAVPRVAVTNLLQERPSGALDLEGVLHRVTELEEERGRLDLSEYEAYAKASGEIEILLQQARALAQGSPSNLVTVAEAAQRVWADDTAIEIARDAIQGSPAVELQARRILANCLQRKSWLAAEKERDESVAEALSHAQILVNKSTKPKAADLTLLAQLLEATSGHRAEAFSKFQQALALARKEGESDLRPYFRGLFRTSKDLSEASTWFKQVEDHGGAEEFDWTYLAREAEEAENFGFAGEAWMRAAELKASSANLCGAGFSFWFADQLDRALDSLRKCVEVAALEKESGGTLTQAYTAMSAIFFDRGVYDQSIAYAKQAIELFAEDPWPYLHLSRSLHALGRDLEAVAAAESAIRFSDGKYGDMHFALGAAYFSLGNWERSARAFTKAAELDPKDTASAFNVGLCLQRQMFYLDAAKWFEEVLKRNPSHPDREEILRKIRALRQ